MMEKRQLKNLKAWLAISLVSVLSISCNNQPKKPNNILDVETMTKLLTDMHLLEIELKKPNTSPQKMDTLYSVLFKKYKIDRLQLEKNLDYYTKNSVVLEKVYNDVIIQLNRKEIK